jgi:hypothetical protein
VLSNIQEVKARGGRVIAVVTNGNSELAGMVDHMIPVPDTIDMLTPILTTIPLQLLAYHVAVMRGCNVDMPRNLAKSVTVSDGRGPGVAARVPLRVVLQRVLARRGPRVTRAAGPAAPSAPATCCSSASRLPMTNAVLEWMADKVTGLRSVPGARRPGAARLLLPAAPDDDVGAACSSSASSRCTATRARARRPSFSDAAPPDVAIPLYDRFVRCCASARPAAWRRASSAR